MVTTPIASDDLRGRYLALLDAAERLLDENAVPFPIAVLLLEALELRVSAEAMGTERAADTGGPAIIDGSLITDLRRIATFGSLTAVSDQSAAATASSTVELAHVPTPETSAEIRTAPALSDETLILRDAIHRFRTAASYFSGASGENRAAWLGSRTWVEKILLAGSAAVAIIFMSTLFRTPGTDMKWHVTYWDNRDLSGVPRVVENLKVLEASYGTKPPVPALRRINYSIRWESGLIVAHPTKYRFRLTSDDGSRLFVDDRKVVDTWQIQAMKSAEGTVDLAPGTHLLRVEFFQAGGDGKLELEVAADGEPLRKLRPEELKLIQ